MNSLEKKYVVYRIVSEINFFGEEEFFRNEIETFQTLFGAESMIEHVPEHNNQEYFIQILD